jgi:hypothetical protein
MNASSTPTPKATPATLLDSLSQVGGYVGVAIQLGEVLVPIGKALVTDIKKIGSSTSSVDYQVLVQTDLAELNTVDQLSTDDLTAINAELVRLGAAPIPLT